MRKASQDVPYILAFSQQQQNQTQHNNAQRPNKRNLLVNKLVSSVNKRNLLVNKLFPGF